MLFDSHAHLVADDRVRYPPLPSIELSAEEDLKRPFTVEQLLQQMDQHGVARAALVQRGSIYGYDNAYICDSAARFPDRLVAVCAINANQPTAVADVEYWTRERGAHGIRLMGSLKGTDLSWLDSAAALQVWQLASAADLPVTVHFFPRTRAAGLAALERILSQFPRTPVVIDHVSNVVISREARDYGLDDLLAQVMRFARVYTKFTTIPLGQCERDGIDTAALLARLVERFGAQRIMWGSDVTQSKGDYGYMVGLATRATALLTGADREQVLYGTGAAVYGAGT
ncbi:MAG TPA: amidohydrolase family protein [Steroidobacteraceae bacterium]|nr:amidohydrolase family protein [Steroidobacteraceae bacterium]